MRRLEQALAARGLARLAGGGARLGGLHGLVDDGAALLGVLLEVLGQAVGDDLHHERAHEGAAELGLGLALELGVTQLDGDDGGQALADVVTREIGVLLLEDVLLARVVVDDAGERRAEALEVHASLGGVDVVGEAHDGLGVGGVPLDGHLDLAHLLGVGVVGLAGEVDGLLEAVGHLLTLVQELHKVHDAAGVAELLHARGELALVREGDLEVAVEERHLLQAVVQGVVVVDRGLEDLVVRPERRGGARGLGGADLLHLLHGLAARELHLVDAAVALDLDHEALGEGVHHRDANAVQAAGHLVGVVVELAAGVEDGEDDLERGDLLHGVLGHGDAAAVVHHGDGVVSVDGHRDLGAEARERLVHGVVHDLVDEVVESARARGADVHARALAHRLKALEDLDLAGVVCVLILCCHAHILSRRARGARDPLTGVCLYEPGQTNGHVIE